MMLHRRNADEESMQGIILLNLDSDNDLDSDNTKKSIFTPRTSLARTPPSPRTSLDRTPPCPLTQTKPYAPHQGPLGSNEDNSDSKECPNRHNLIVVCVVKSTVVQTQNLTRKQISYRCE
jgi:hypothetical protein